MKTTTAVQARIFLTDYASYNEGNQFKNGHWVDLSDFSDQDELQEYIDKHFEMAGIEDPEIMITDYEGFPECYYSESGMDFEKLYEFINMDDDDRQMLTMYAEATGYGIEDVTLEDANDKFHGTADSEANFAEQMAEECGEIPEGISSWIVIDWEASWNYSLRHDYNTATDDNRTIWFFRNH